MRKLALIAILMVAGCAYGDGAIGYQTNVYINCDNVTANDSVCNGGAASRADPTTNIAPLTTW